MSWRYAFVVLSSVFLLALPAHGGEPSDDANNGNNGGDCNNDCDQPGGQNKEGNPIDVRSGNKYQAELVYRSVGELPLVFSWHYNSRHFQTGLCQNCNPGGSGTMTADVIGQWTYSYSGYLLLDPQQLGTGSGIIELRRDDGQSQWFVEQGTQAGELAPQAPCVVSVSMPSPSIITPVTNTVQPAA